MVCSLRQRAARFGDRLPRQSWWGSSTLYACLVLVGLWVAILPASAQDSLPIIDMHMHPRWFWMPMECPCLALVIRCPPPQAGAGEER